MGDYEIIIVGAGIAGSTLASLLAPKCKVALVDRDVRGLPGSTGHAPGVVAQINSVPVLTELARRSVKHYRSIPDGFDRVGGMEVAFGAAGAEWLRARQAIAVARGLEHQVLCPIEAQKISPMVRDDAEGAIFFPNDGTANAKVIAGTAQDQAEAHGAKLIDGDVLSINPNGGGYTLILASGAFLTTRRVVIATGIWAGQLLPALASTAVTFAHPYIYAERRPKRNRMLPFTRFPNELVYLRDHGERDGMGTYAHDPVTVRIEVTSTLPSAYSRWIPAFDHSVRKGLLVLPETIGKKFGSQGEGKPVRAEQAQPNTAKALAAKDVPYMFSGMFTITPDGIPLVGRLASPGLYSAVGCWVTQAAGAMGVLADQILADLGLAQPVAKDRWLRTALDPMRFDDTNPERREEEAKNKYRDIWNKKQQDDAVKRQQLREVDRVLSKL